MQLLDVARRKMLHQQHLLKEEMFWIQVSNLPNSKH
jgi:hypothetical protein